MPGVEHIRSWIGAPLLVKGRLIGILNVDSRQAGAYDEETGATVMTFASQAAVAIENARLYEELQQALRPHDRVLQNVSHELRTPLTIIHGYADFMLERASGSLDRDTREGLEIMLDQQRQLQHLVEQLIAAEEAAPAQAQSAAARRGDMDGTVIAGMDARRSARRPEHLDRIGSRPGPDQR